MATPQERRPAPDHRVALRSAARRLSLEFDGTFGAETIERFVRASYAAVAEGAFVRRYLPLLTERRARQQLHALRATERKRLSGLPAALFLGEHDAGRTQMALGFFTRLADGMAVTSSGGTDPAGRVSPVVIASMAERGIDISEQVPKPWADELVRSATIVVVFGGRRPSTVVSCRRLEIWPIQDPTGLEVEDVRPIRDEIERRLRALLAELVAATQS